MICGSMLSDTTLIVISSLNLPLATIFIVATPSFKAFISPNSLTSTIDESELSNVIFSINPLLGVTFFVNLYLSPRVIKISPSGNATLVAIISLSPSIT